MEFINLSLSLSLSVYLSLCLSLFRFPSHKVYLYLSSLPWVLSSFFSSPLSLPFSSAHNLSLLFFSTVYFLHPTVPLTLLSYSIFFYLPRPILFSFFISSSTLPFSLLFSSLLLLLDTSLPTALKSANHLMICALGMLVLRKATRSAMLSAG